MGWYRSAFCIIHIWNCNAPLLAKYYGGTQVYTYKCKLMVYVGIYTYQYKICVYSVLVSTIHKSLTAML